ncbi:MAG: replication-associated recombination protein A [bacterium]
MTPRTLYCMRVVLRSSGGVYSRARVGGCACWCVGVSKSLEIRTFRPCFQTPRLGYGAGLARRRAGIYTGVDLYDHAMTDLWSKQRRLAVAAVEPLAVRMRPRTLDEFAGQGHILGPGKLLRRMLQADALSSLILFGPPGVGKTTLAEVIAATLSRHYERENASGVGVARIREIIASAERRLQDNGQRTILFLDEIHRFSKAQQDVLLGDVERGVITLIGATTENPLFAVNSALVSRSTLLRFEPLSEEEIITLLRRAMADKERGYGTMDLAVADDALALWARLSDGDARRALTALEVAVRSSEGGNLGNPPLGTSDLRAGRLGTPHLRGGSLGAKTPGPEVRGTQTRGTLTITIDLSTAEESIQQKAAVYDGTGDEHYDAISAMIKSIRGCDPDAAVYWLARMLEAGEDPRFIARRLAVIASEDVGNADPRAITLADSAWQLTERLGMPECRITLSQCAIYLALTSKSNASIVAIDEALEDVRAGRTLPVPAHVKDTNVRKAASKGGIKGGQRYDYNHEVTTTGPAGEIGGITAQDYLGTSKTYYRPSERGAEKILKERLEAIRAERKRLQGPG